MLLSACTGLLVASAAFSSIAAADSPPTVTLPQGSVAGNYISKSTVSLPRPVAAYHAIPYVAPPIGDLRYRFPQPPLRWSGVLNATTYGPVCPQAAATPAWDESCLTIDIFTPPGTTTDSKLPVLLYIAGGLFIRGSGRALDIASMVSQAPKDFIGITFNYRIGALGFLPSVLTQQANLQNLGLADQIAAIKWVNKNIHLFGGDPNEVTLYGISAGAHSVGYHLLNVDVGIVPLFKRVIFGSGGPTARAFPHYTDARLGGQSADFIASLNCTSAEADAEATFEADAEATFDCLRKLPQEVIRDTNNIFTARASWDLLTPFQPVVDEKFIKQAAHLSWEQGKFHKVDILTGSCLNEGSTWAPTNLTTDAQMSSWFSSIIPKFNNGHLRRVLELYPSPTKDGSPYADSPFSAQWSRMRDAYGDYAYIATSVYNAIAASNWESLGGKVFKFNFADTTSVANATLGVTHASDSNYLTGVSANTALNAQLIGYFTSFILTGDPNTYAPSNATFWPPFQTGRHVQMKFNGSSSTVETDNERATAKAFWNSVPSLLDH